MMNNNDSPHPEGNEGMAVTVRQSDAQPMVVAEPEHQPITPAQARVEAVAALLAPAYAAASQLKLTPEESKALSEDFPDHAFSLGAGGDPNLVYIEHAYLRQRLNQVLGLGQAVPVRRREWAEEFEYVKLGKRETGVRVYADICLVVRGCLVGEAVSSGVYYRNNAKSTYDDALESAKSNAFRRCCKEFGVGLQVWIADWCEGWKQRQRAAAHLPVQPQRHARPAPAPEKKAEEPKHATEKTKAWFIGMIPQDAREGAREYFIKTGSLLPTEYLEDLPLSRIPTTKAAAVNLVKCIGGFIDGAEIVDTDSVPEDEEWKSVSIHFGQNKGVKLGDLPKAKLFGWWANWEPTPHKGEISPLDERLREALDEAGQHYEFTKKD